MRKNLVFLIIAILLLIGCAPSIKMSKDELAKVEPGEGVVFGSILIKVADNSDDNDPDYNESLNKTVWYIPVHEFKDSLIPPDMLPFSGYSIKATSGGDEVPFIAKLPVGRYHFGDITEEGFGAYRAAFLNTSFQVFEGETTYIGKLLLTVSNDSSTIRNYFGSSSKFWIRADVDIEDAQEEALGYLENEYEKLDGKFLTQLMVLRSVSPPIYNESYKGNYSKVQSLLKSGVSPNIKTPKGWTPLIISAAEGHTEVVRLLIDNGANVNATNDLGRTSIMFAAKYGYTDIVELLGKHGAKVNVISSGLSPLMSASAAGQSETVAKLIEYGADVNQKGLEGNDALQFAIAPKGHIDIVKLLLDNNAMPNRKNDNGVLPLHIAIDNGHEIIVKLLLHSGANPNLTTNLKPLPDMMPPPGENNQEILKEIESGKVEISALMIATQHGRTESIKALLGNGANVNFRNIIGGSALSYARKFNQKDIEKILLEAGAIF